MPLTHEPEDPMGGPGSSFLSTALSSKVRRRRKKKSSLPQQQQQQQQERRIGEDLLEWQDENVESVPTAAPIKPSLKTVKPKKRSDPTPKRRKQQTTQSPPPVTPSSALTSSYRLLGGGLDAAAVTRPTGGAGLVTAAPRARHALAVDTRVLATEEGMAIFHNVHKQALDFIGTCIKRGAAPCILVVSSTHQQQDEHQGSSRKSPRGTGAPAVQATAMNIGKVRDTLLAEKHRDGSVDNDDCFLLSPVSIRPPANVANVQNRKAVLVPKRLLAHDSWKLFGELVDAVVRQEEAEQGQHCSNNAHVSMTTAPFPPLDVTILTSDVSFLCDTKEQSHKSSATKFWARVRPHFESNTIRSIDVVVAETGCITLSNAVCNQHTEQPVAAATEGGKDTKAQESSKEMQVDSEPPTAEDANAIVTSAAHKVASAKCLEGIKTGLLTRAEADFKKTRSCEDPPNAVVVKISTITNNRMGYYELLLNWLNKLLALGRDKGRVSFELPEDLDGMQCALAFEATYKVFPFRADSIAAAGAMADLRLLSHSKFEVLQLMPLSCVDAHLVFGQPLEVCAKFENDLDQYNEMKALVGSVLRYLSEKEVALVLRGADMDDCEYVGEAPLYHTDGQTFLLMGEDLPCRNLMEPSQSDTDTNPNSELPATGMLVRYAIAEQLLDVSRNSKRFQPEGTADSKKELAEYVESSLDSLDSSDGNAVFDFAMQQDNVAPSKTVAAIGKTSDVDVSIAEDDPWADNNGVGARLAHAKLFNRNDSANDMSSSDDDSLNDMWDTFHYG